ncbi:hypothetical protein BDV59DRAFT_207924 [Aspergillus ambiguus]|uniref:Zn(II)2Cys6 transcription factor n=1 Tax=Aspergillus ambiguus TaxID=176160 RepID=UPI003CCE4E27
MASSSSHEAAGSMETHSALCGKKVKCDRAQPFCGACMRLQLRYSYERYAASPVHDMGDLFGYTQAGTKRKRARQACASCRAVKAKCSGRGPCERCFSRKMTCELRTNIGRVDRIANSLSIPTPGTLNLGLFVSDSRPEWQAMAQDWIREVQSEPFRLLGRNTITHLKVLVLLMPFHFHAGNFGEAWCLLPLAARSAFTMRLNYEQAGLDTVVQEEHRRLVWTIYQQDRLCSGGIEDLAVCPVERMHIRLPCDERSFEMGVPSRAGFLNGKDPGPTANVDARAFRLKLLEIRHKVLRYTKHVRRQGKSPAESGSEMEALQRDLDSFEKDVPTGLKFTPQKLAIIAHSGEAGTYAGLQTLWIMCHCDLYRFFLPGILESVSKEALALTPPDFIQKCQRACLNSAVQFCNFWSSLYHLQSSECLGDEFLVTSIYQVAQILYHLRHLLPDKDDICMPSLKRKLANILLLAEPLKQIYKNSANCLQASEWLIGALERDSVVPSSAVSETVGPLESIPREQHLASRYSILMHLYRSEESIDNLAGYQAGRCERAPPLVSGDVTMTHSHSATDPNLGDEDSGVGQGFGENFSDIFLCDPFNVQLDGYYDPQLEFMFE